MLVSLGNKIFVFWGVVCDKILLDFFIRILLCSKFVYDLY